MACYASAVICSAMWITVTSGELAERTMHKEGLRRTNRAAREDMLKRVCQCLRLLRTKGQAVSRRDPDGCCLVWELTKTGANKPPILREKS